MFEKDQFEGIHRDPILAGNVGTRDAWGLQRELRTEADGYLGVADAELISPKEVEGKNPGEW